MFSLFVLYYEKVCRRRGRLEEAAAHATWLLRLKKRALGEESLATADTLFLLGQIYKSQAFGKHETLCIILFIVMLLTVSHLVVMTDVV